ncbi:protein NODULATION SIGNALING PATHWAY 2-like [Rhodamnia argentea]|uniref:Protein NODULATION SIGNALING PATHWAY 2-like n=1 Tax=Rhodamnia argentea TaxID=178133 RepID=A0A8B8Q460_9MYRT|nr:protein NODULATION SIGNALING PATHWAY 2-like [Rhodamnia argentea]
MMMMQSEFPPISWPYHDLTDSTIDPLGNYNSNFEFHVGEYGVIPSPISDTTGNPVAQFGMPTAFDASLGIGYELEDFAMDFEGLEAFLNGDEPENTCDYSEMSDGSFALQQMTTETWSPSTLSMSKSEESNSVGVSAARWLPWTLPTEEMEIDNLLGLQHLLEAYGQAGDNEQKELMEVISRRIAEKSSPLGEVLERLAFYLCQTHEDRSSHLRRELCKNLEASFLAFYQAFPYGRFAHFAANSALLKAMPKEAETIHVVDFDMGEGIQWPPVIEAVAWRNKMLKLTLLTCEEDCGHDAQLNWNVDDTKKRLLDHARSFGVKLEVDSMNNANLVNELRKRNEGDTSKEWMVFNCMLGLPHMGRTTTSRRVNDFFRVAKEYLAHGADRFGRPAGIITFSDGNGFEKLNNCSTFGEFFDHSLGRCHSILESMQSDFPPQLLESRIAMETLFIAPFISSLSWLDRWGETRNVTNAPVAQGLDRLPVGRASVAEAQEMLRGKTSYEVRLGEQENQMVLEWKGHEMVRFSTWEYRPKRR